MHRRERWQEMSIPILMEPSGYTLGFISSTQIGHSNNVRKLYLYTNSYFVLMWMHPFDNTKTALPKWWRSSGSYASKTRPRNLLSDTAGSPPVCGHLPDNEPERKRTNHSTWNEPKVQVDALHTHTQVLLLPVAFVLLPYRPGVGRRVQKNQQLDARVYPFRLVMMMIEFSVAFINVHQCTPWHT